jgi:DNA-binding beta-propeller fold protein YncE
MFLCEHYSQRLRFITPEGFVSTIAAGAGNTHGAFLPKFGNYLTGIAVSPDGSTLYLSEGAANKIWKIVLTY